MIMSALALLVSISAMAAEFGEIRYPDRPLNLRKARGAKAKWVGTLQMGQKVRVAYMKDGWVAVFEPYMTGKAEVRIAGYANSKYLKKKPCKKKIEPWGEIMHPVTVLNIRAERSPRSSKVGAVTPNTNIRVDFPEDDWYGVFEGRATIRSKLNVIGYVKGDYLEPAPAPDGEGLPHRKKNQTATRGATEVRGSVAPAPEAEASVPDAKSAPVEAWGQTVILDRKVIVRKERSSKSNYVKTLLPGDTVKLGMLRNGWYAVFSADESVQKEFKAQGYVFKRQLEGKSSVSVLQAPAEKRIEPAAASPSAKKIVIKPDPFAKSRRPDPKVDQTRHGIRFKVLEKAETSSRGKDVIQLKVFVEVTKLPKAELLEDFADTLWKENRKSGKMTAIEVYLPGMDLDDLSFAVARYTSKEPIEFWARRTALYGTSFMK